MSIRLPQGEGSEAEQEKLYAPFGIGQFSCIKAGCYGYGARDAARLARQIAA